MTKKKASNNDSVNFPKTYNELHRTFDYDHKKATVLAEAMTELVAIAKRKKYLESLLIENNNLKPFLWGSQDGRVTALHDLDDEHLINILEFLPANGRKISAEVKAEARSRGFEIPDDENLKTYSMRLESGDIIEELDNEW